MLSHRAGDGIVQQYRKTRHELPHGLSIPHQHTTSWHNLRAEQVPGGRSQNRYATEKLSGGQPMQNDLSAPQRDGKVPALTSQEKEQSLGRLVTLNDYGGSRNMPVGRRGQDRAKFGRRQPTKESRPESVGEANNARAGQVFAAAIHINLSPFKSLPGDRDSDRLPPLARREVEAQQQRQIRIPKCGVDTTQRNTGVSAVGLVGEPI